MATRWLFKTEPSVYSYQQLVKDKNHVAAWGTILHSRISKTSRRVSRFHLPHRRGGRVGWQRRGRGDPILAKYTQGYWWSISNRESLPNGDLPREGPQTKNFDW